MIADYDRTLTAQSPSMNETAVVTLGSPTTRFPLSSAALSGVADQVLVRARAGGASAAETEVSQAFGLSVTVRKGDVETIAYNRDKGIGVTVYVGTRRGHASTADFSADAIEDTVAKALTIARYTAKDDCAGLADPALLARNWSDLDLYHPWDLTVEDAIALGRDCEAAALAVDRRLTNSEGATVSVHEGEFVYANTLGFSGGYASSRHGIYCAVIGEDDGAMQRDDWYTSARSPHDLESTLHVGRLAGERTVRRLGARRLPTLECPVLYEAPIATGLIGHYVSATSGGSLYRKSSFLVDSLGREVFPPHVSIREEPHLRRGQASAPFDDEGVATRPRDVVRDGVVQGYFLGSYSARKLGLVSTGNAGGNHNLVVTHGSDDLQALLRRMDRGVLVTELLGHGVNPVTGDYSRGAAGYWVERGEIAHPVEEITIAGNLGRMYRDIVAIGNDVDRRGSRHCGSVLVGAMTVAGN
jgi:PmbA protein